MKKTPIITLILICFFIISPTQWIHAKPQIPTSMNHSSINPLVVLSNSGIKHLFFQHEMTCLYFEYYHTVEQLDGSWSIPVQVDRDTETIYTMQPSESGITIYYYNSGYSKPRGIYKAEYDENENKWLTPLLVFGQTHIAEFLNLPENESSRLIWAVHSLWISDDETIFISWNAKLRKSYRDFEGLYFVSSIDREGSISSQPILHYQGNFDALNPLTFVYRESLFLYDSTFKERAVFFPNKSWSNWQSNGLKQYYGIKPIANQYLLHWGGNCWEIIDLATENLTVTPLTFLTDSSSSIDLEIKVISQSKVQFDLLVINNAIELWQYQNTSKLWTPLSYLNYTTTGHWSGDYSGFWPIASKPFDIELAQDETFHYAFWSQKVDEQTNEIFYVSYNVLNNEWSPVIQVTDTNTITDDYVEATPGYTFVIVCITLLMAIILLKKHKIRKK